MPFRGTILVYIFLNIFCGMSLLMTDTDLTSDTHAMVSLTTLLVTMNMPKLNLLDSNRNHKF